MLFMIKSLSFKKEIAIMNENQSEYFFSCETTKCGETLIETDIKAINRKLNRLGLFVTCKRAQRRTTDYKGKVDDR